jgi:dTDP-4-amino-4,6-dideoxygalactose transaminase
VGRRQLGKVDGWVALRRTHAARMSDGLRDLDALRLPETPPGVEPAFYRYHVELRSELLAPGWDRDRVVAALAAEGVPATQGGCSEIQRERAFRTVRTPPRVLPNAAALTRTTLTLPVHHRMSNSDVDDVVAAVRKVLQEAAG